MEPGFLAADRGLRTADVSYMIEIQDVFKTFGNNQVLTGVNLTIKKGETIVIIGRSGCGKSVLLKLIMGLLKPDSGRILVNGEDITGFNDKRTLTPLGDPDQMMMDSGQSQKGRNRSFFGADTAIGQHQNGAAGINSLFRLDK